MNRLLRFAFGGLGGFVVQLVTLGLLTEWLEVHYLTATIVAVEAAILLNFIWHERWTWRDRMGPEVSRFAAFARFAGANGVVSLAASVAMMPLLVAAGIPAIPANLVTIAVCGVLNFWLGNRLVFAL